MFTNKYFGDKDPLVDAVRGVINRKSDTNEAYKPSVVHTLWSRPKGGTAWKYDSTHGDADKAKQRASELHKNNHETYGYSHEKSHTSTIRQGQPPAQGPRINFESGKVHHVRNGDVWAHVDEDATLWMRPKGTSAWRYDSTHEQLINARDRAQYLTQQGHETFGHIHDKSQTPMFRKGSQPPQGVRKLDFAEQVNGKGELITEADPKHKFQVGDIVRPSKSSTNKMKITGIERTKYYGRPATFVDGEDTESGSKIRRPIRTLIKVDEADQQQPVNDGVPVVQVIAQLDKLGGSIETLKSYLHNYDEPEIDSALAELIDSAEESVGKVADIMMSDDDVDPEMGSDDDDNDQTSNDDPTGEPVKVYKEHRSKFSDLIDLSEARGRKPHPMKVRTSKPHPMGGQLVTVASGDTYHLPMAKRPVRTGARLNPQVHKGMKKATPEHQSSENEDGLEPSQHPIARLRVFSNLSSGGKLQMKDGSHHDVARQHAISALHHYNQLKPSEKEKAQTLITKSKDHFNAFHQYGYKGLIKHHENTGGDKNPLALSGLKGPLKIGEQRINEISSKLLSRYSDKANVDLEKTDAEIHKIHKAHNIGHPTKREKPMSRETAKRYEKLLDRVGRRTTGIEMQMQHPNNEE